MDRSDAADAARFRWILSGHGYFMGEQFLCGHPDVTDEDKDQARAEIDTAMLIEQEMPRG